MRIQSEFPHDYPTSALGNAHWHGRNSRIDWIRPLRGSIELVHCEEGTRLDE